MFGSRVDSGRWVLAVAVALLLLAPPFFARYPPILDLAQQAAQIRLLEEAWGDPSGPYRVQWSAPNKLSYPLLAVGLALGGSEWGPRLGLIGSGALFLLAVFLLTRRFDRPIEHAALAAVFLYSGSYYGGFLNFVVGALAFALWLGEIGRASNSNATRDWLRLSGCGLLLYLTHILWLALAALVLVVPGPRPWRLARVVRGGVALAPFVAAAAAWYLSLGDRRWHSGARYMSSLFERLTRIEFWSTWTLGGLRGPGEAILLLVILGWVLFCIARRRDRSTSGELWLAKTGVVLALLSFVLPDSLGDTALLSYRFAPFSAVLFLLSLPRAGVPSWVRIGFATVVVTAWAVFTAATWRGFDRDEMRGFEASIAAVPTGSRLLELDFERKSPRVWLDPHFQAAAYAQLERDVVLGYSFASTPSSLVVLRGGEWPLPWTRGLEHEPRRLGPADLDWFDFVLLHARPEQQEEIAAATGRLDERAGEGPWRLFSVRAAPKAGVEPAP